MASEHEHAILRVELPVWFRWLMIPVIGVGFALLALAAVVFNRGGASLIGILAAAYLALMIVLAVIGLPSAFSAYVATESAIVQIRPLGGRRRIKWSEIVHVSTSRWARNLIYITGRSGEVIAVHGGLPHYGELAELLRTRATGVDEDSIRREPRSRSIWPSVPWLTIAAILAVYFLLKLAYRH